MEFLCSFGHFRTTLIGVAIRPASKPPLSPLHSLERDGLRAPNGRLTMPAPKRYKATRTNASAEHRCTLENP